MIHVTTPEEREATRAKWNQMLVGKTVTDVRVGQDCGMILTFADGTVVNVAYSEGYGETRINNEPQWE